MRCLTQGRKTRYNNQQLDELVPSLQFSVQKIDRLSSSIVSFAFLHAVQCLSYCNRCKSSKDALLSSLNCTIYTASKLVDELDWNCTQCTTPGIAFWTLMTPTPSLILEHWSKTRYRLPVHSRNLAVDLKCNGPL